MGRRDTLSRSVAAGVALVLIASIVLTQRSLTALGSSGALLLLLLNPVAMGTILLGTIDGCALGALAGASLALHARLAPLDIHEITLAGPLISVCLYTVFGLVLGMLLSSALPKARTKGTTLATITGSCLVASALHTAGLACLTPFAPTPAGLVLQVLASCAITSIPCLVCSAIFAWRDATGDDIGVREAFQSSILLVVVFAFIITSTISHLNATHTEL